MDRHVFGGIICLQKTIKALIGDDLWNEYYKFCVVRNPFDQLVSAFNFFSRPEGFRSRLREYLFHAAYLTNPQLKYAIEKIYSLGMGAAGLKHDFEVWLCSAPLPLDENKYMIDGEMCMDYVIKYESLFEGIEHVCAKLNIEYQPDKLAYLKKSRKAKIPLENYFSSKSIKIVEAAYKKQLEIFEYSKPWQSGAH